MKKRLYIAPVMEVVEINTMTLLAGSGVTSNGIGFGGEDTGGDLDPSAPELLGLPEELFF